MHLRVQRDVRGEHRDAEGASQLAGKIDETRGLLCLAGLEARERHVVDGRKQQTERGAADDQRDPHVVVPAQHAQVPEPPHGEDDEHHPHADQSARVRERPGAGEQAAAEQRAGGGRDAARHQREPGLGGRELQDGLGEEREHERAAVQREPERHEQQQAGGEVAILQHAQLDDRVPVSRRELPHQQADQRDAREDREAHDPGVREPVLRIPLLEHVLERADARREQRDPEPVDIALVSAMIGRVLQEGRDQERGRDPDRDVDEEAPVPLVIIGDPSPEGGSERRRDDHAQQEDGLHHPLLLEGEDLAQGRLRGGQQRGPARALHDAPEDQLDQGMRGAAEEGGDHEEQDRERQVALPAEALGEERRHGQKDDVREDVTGADPADLLVRGPQVPGHRGQRDVDDRGVEHLHDRRSDETEQDQPAIAGDEGGRLLGRRQGGHGRTARSAAAT